MYSIVLYCTRMYWTASGLVMFVFVGLFRSNSVFMEPLRAHFHVNYTEVSMANSASLFWSNIASACRLFTHCSSDCSFTVHTSYLSEYVCDHHCLVLSRPHLHNLIPSCPDFIRFSSSRERAERVARAAHQLHCGRHHWARRLHCVRVRACVQRVLRVARVPRRCAPS